MLARVHAMGLACVLSAAARVWRAAAPARPPCPSPPPPYPPTLASPSSMEVLGL